MARAKRVAPELRVVFDTNILITETPYDFVRIEVKSLIEENKDHRDICIKWYIPDIVIKERHYQMFKKATDLIPSVNKLERLLGVSLNTSNENINHQIKNSITGIIGEYKFNILPVDTSKINWEEIIDNAAFRRPPFEEGTKEKGFRDAIISESFLQLVETSPKTPNTCRLIIVSNDSALIESIKVRSSEAKNVKVLKSVAELKGYINTLVSQISEEFVAEIKELASLYFFKEDDKESVSYKENIVQSIKDKYHKELNASPPGAIIRKNGTYFIGDTRFLKKERTRVYWATQISVEAKAYNYEYKSSPFFSGGTITGITGTGGSVGTAATTVNTPSFAPGQISPGVFKGDLDFYPSAGILGSSIYGKVVGQPSMAVQSGGLLGPAITNMEEKLVKTGTSTFEVAWSANINQSKKFSKPSIDDIKYIDTEWD